VASARGNPTLIGAFVVGSVALLALAVILFGSGRMFEQRDRLVSYFDHSVIGLDVGAPVIFRGVQVGDVTQIAAIVNSETFEVAVPVYFDVVEGSIDVLGSAPRGLKGIQRWIDVGLRAQLKSQSLITGKLYLDLDLHPDAPADYKGLDPKVLEMPTVPTEMQQIRREARAVIDRLTALPLEELLARLTSAAAGLDRLLNKPELAQAVEGLDATLEETRQLMAGLNARVDGVADRADGALLEIQQAAARADSALASLEKTVAEGSPLQYQLIATLQELEAAARSLRLLSDSLSRQPEQLLFGKPAEGGSE
jgi:paraquat-inducible protein B